MRARRWTPVPSIERRSENAVHLVRNTLLRAAGNRRLEHHLTRRRFVRASVRRFMPGEHLSDAMSAAERLGAEGLASTVTFLGEDVATEEAAETALQEYEL